MGRKANPYTRVSTVLESLNANWKQYWFKSVGLEEADRISRESTQFGRAVHSIAENFLVGKPIETQPTEREQFCGGLLVKWMKEARVKPLEIAGQRAVEIELKSEVHGLVGHPDLITMFGDSLILFCIDWKTSKECRKEYPLQLAAYAMMLEEMYGLRCDDGAIIRTPSDPNISPQFEPHEFHSLKEKYLPIFLQGLDVYNYFNNKGRWKK